jgi:hypothetical protein
MSTIYTRATKGSALTWTEGDANITNLNTDKIEAVADDATPSLGGDLDVGTHSIITSVEDGDITIAPDGLGSVVAQSDTLILGALTDPEAVITTDGATSLLLDTNDGTDSGTITITAGADGDIEIAPNGTGSVVLDGQSWPQAAPASDGEYLEALSDGTLAWTDSVKAKTIYENVKNVSGVSLTKGTPVTQVGVVGTTTVTVEAARADDPTKLAIGVLNETLADDDEGQMIVLGEIKGVNTSGFTVGDRIYLGATGGYTNVKPTATDVAVQFLGVVFRVDASTGSGFITGTLVEDSVRYSGSAFQFWDGSDWVSLPAPGIADVVDDTTPQLGGNLDVNGNSIVSVSNGNIVLEPNGTGDVYLNADTVRVGDENANATITTWGTADLILNTNAGSNSGSITVQDGTGSDIIVASQNDINLTIENSANKGVKIVEADIGEPESPLLVPSIQPAGSGNTLLVYASSELNLGAGTGNVIIESVSGTVEIASDVSVDGDLDLLVGTISTSTEDTDITITPNGTGVVVVDSDLDVVTGNISTSTTDGDLTLAANGTGVIVIDGEVTINADITDDPTDDTTVVAYLKVTSNAGVYYLPMYQ